MATPFNWDECWNKFIRKSNPIQRDWYLRKCCSNPAIAVHFFFPIPAPHRLLRMNCHMCYVDNWIAWCWQKDSTSANSWLWLDCFDWGFNQPCGAQLEAVKTTWTAWLPNCFNVTIQKLIPLPKCKLDVTWCQPNSRKFSHHPLNNLIKQQNQMKIFDHILCTFPPNKNDVGWSRLKLKIALTSRIEQIYFLPVGLRVFRRLGLDGAASFLGLGILLSAVFESFLSMNCLSFLVHILIIIDLTSEYRRRRVHICPWLAACKYEPTAHECSGPRFTLCSTAVARLDLKREW